MSSLRLADRKSLADLVTYLSRARAIDPDGAVRLIHDSATLAVYVGVLPGTGLLGEGTVVGLRVFAASPTASPDGGQDVVVPLGALADRAARLRDATSTTLDLPPVRAQAGWAALTPPRSGWELAGEVPEGILESIARQGISDVARASPEGSGGKAVQTVRRSVWSRPADTQLQISAGMAFGAYALGFLRGGAPARVLRCGRWTRLTLPAGHVLSR